MTCQMNTHTILPESCSSDSSKTVWCSHGDWTRLQKAHQIKVDSNGAYSVFVRNDNFVEEEEESGSVTNLLRNTLNTIKCSVANFIPYIYFSMTCKAYIQEHPDSRSFGIVVIVCQSNSCTSRSNSDINAAIIGKTHRAKMVKAGKLRVRLVSNDFEPDVAQGEDPEMCKTEPDFKGQEFEKQFACRFKLGQVKEGIFGKVIVEHVKESREVSPVFEFNLTRGVETQHLTTISTCNQLFPDPPSTPLNSKATTECARRPIRELADSLNIARGNNWRLLAQHLGLSPKEINRHGNNAEPLESLFTTYKSRGGSEDEIVQSMYEISKKLSPLCQKRTRCDSPEARSVRRRLSFNAHDSVLSQTTISLESEDEDDADEDLNSLSRCDTLPLLDNGALPLTSSPFTITPPTTPIKRSSSDSGSPLSPSLRMNHVFTFGRNQVEDQSPQIRQNALNDSTLWQLSGGLYKEWKHLSRSLELPETELYNIEHTHKDLRECAYQALLRWKDMFPQRFTYDTLFSALCQNGLRSHAMKYCAQ